MEQNEFCGRGKHGRYSGHEGYQKKLLIIYGDWDKKIPLYGIVISMRSMLWRVAIIDER
jgi:hypothetical protein